jgi:hypothetical protein
MYFTYKNKIFLIFLFLIISIPLIFFKHFIFIAFLLIIFILLISKYYYIDNEKVILYICGVPFKEVLIKNIKNIYEINLLHTDHIINHKKNNEVSFQIIIKNKKPFNVGSYYINKNSKTVGHHLLETYNFPSKIVNKYYYHDSV